MSMFEKIEKAEKHYQKAERCVQIRMFNWSRNYLKASHEYQNAAFLYQALGLIEQFKLSLEKSAECEIKTNSPLLAAMRLAQMLSVSRDNCETEALANKIVDLCIQAGTIEKACSFLSEAAAMVIKDNPEKALNLYRRAYELSKSTKQMNKYAIKIARLNISMGLLDEAVNWHDLVLNEVSKGEIGSDGLVISSILVQLKRRKEVEAQETFKKWVKLCSSEELDTLGSLFQAYNDTNLPLLRKVFNSEIVKRLEVEYVQLANDILHEVTLKYSPPFHEAVTHGIANIALSQNNHGQLAQGVHGTIDEIVHQQIHEGNDDQDVHGRIGQIVQEQIYEENAAMSVGVERRRG